MITDLDKVYSHCEFLFSQSTKRNLPFHNFLHTVEVLEYSKIIAINENVTPEEFNLVSIAALYHDTGITETYQGHEAMSAQYAQLYLEWLGFLETDILTVVSCIQATKMPQNPKSKLQQIICDADLAHLSADNYLYKNKLLREEWETELDQIYSDKEWLGMNIDFLKTHTYFTSYGKNVLSTGKERNIEKLKKKSH
ncbi:HD domain-containing protein [Christiangramia sp. LLG6405-1]|uniref:HD domain-containing protein n=1 Tax=Christiangramia sp. LLG6405-1 TaxID=3160832 RepID=UPI00386458A8